MADSNVLARRCRIGAAWRTAQRLDIGVKASLIYQVLEKKVGTVRGLSVSGTSKDEVKRILIRTIGMIRYRYFQRNMRSMKKLLFA